MTTASVSVVIASRDRPEELRRCVRALNYQTHREFEVVIVSDMATNAMLAQLVPLERIKTAVCNEPNISKARNIGVALSAGEIVALIDDDAIAEPTWLERLVAPFLDPNIAASGGFVRGRNGISYQWQGQTVDVWGVSRSLAVEGVTVPEAKESEAIKTQGTNCAFRKTVLTDLGGFDENFRFYLDESDLNMRIASAGLRTAIVPDAEVQHGYAPSAFRGRDRRPKSLFEIGASQAYFVKKHTGQDAGLEDFEQQQHKRIDAALLAGSLEPRDVRRLRRELAAGISEGRDRDPLPARQLSEPESFKPFVDEQAPHAHRFLTGRWLSRRKLYDRAKEIARQGVPCTVIALSPTALFHRRWFHKDGFWVQTGGIYGKSTRSDPLWSWYRRPTRVQRERALLERTR